MDIVQPEAPAKLMSTIEYLLGAGGLPLLLIGLVLSVVGLLMVTRPVNRRAIAIYAILSLLPGVLAAYAIYSGCVEFREMATATATAELPKPSDFADVAGRAMSNGFWGTIGMILPSLLAIIAFARASRD